MDCHDSVARVCHKGRKEGKWMHYSISEEGMDAVAETLNELKQNMEKEGNSCESCR